MIAERIDALPPERRVSRIRRWLLENTEDSALQTIVREAAEQVGAPIALVSLVLDNIQFFRAAHGLPADLDASRGTDRDLSFCQFVVRDGALLEIEDALDDPRLPQGLVRSHGIRAYLGAPIHLAGRPLGSLCVIDTRPRRFTDQDRAQIIALARAVDARVARWDEEARDGPAPALVRSAVGPLFAEMRNQLSMLMLVADEVRVASTELRSYHRAIGFHEPALGMMPGRGVGERSLGGLDIAADLAGRAADGLLAGVEAMERLVDGRTADTSMGAVARLVGVLSQHLTDTVGGLRWAPFRDDMQAPLPLSEAAAIVATAINGLAGRLNDPHVTGLRGQIETDGDAVSIELTHAALTPEITEAAREDVALSGLTSAVECVAVPGGLRLRLVGP